MKVSSPIYHDPSPPRTLRVRHTLQCVPINLRRQYARLYRDLVDANERLSKIHYLPLTVSHHLSIILTAINSRLTHHIHVAPDLPRRRRRRAYPLPPYPSLIHTPSEALSLGYEPRLPAMPWLFAVRIHKTMTSLGTDCIFVRPNPNTKLLALYARPLDLGTSEEQEPEETDP